MTYGYRRICPPLNRKLKGMGKLGTAMRAEGEL